MRNLRMLLIGSLIVMTITTYVETAEKRMPTVDIDNIGNITLVVYKHFGAIEGYIVFRDKEGKMCSVETRTWYGKITIEDYEREEQLSPGKFQWIETKDKDQLWVYLLDPIPIDKEKIKAKNPKVYFKISVPSWKVSDVAD